MTSPNHPVRAGAAAPLAVAVLLIAAVAVRSSSAAQRAPRSPSIRGRVTVQHVHPVVERRPNIADFGTPAERDLPNRARSVVYLQSAPRGAFEDPPAGRAVMDQRNQTFVPHVLAITVGTTVEFPNSDQFYHDVFSLSKTARFDLGRYPAGKSKFIRFDRPGIVRVFCDIHAHMNAFILVFAHRYFAVTDEEGRYRIDRVPPGTYTVVAWYEGVRQQSQAVTIAGDGKTVESDFTLR
jgi:plastocyanin